MPDGPFEEIFNGPGIVAHEAVAARQHPKTNLHSVGYEPYEGSTRLSEMISEFLGEAEESIE